VTCRRCGKDGEKITLKRPPAVASGAEPPLKSTWSRVESTVVLRGQLCTGWSARHPRPSLVLLIVTASWASG
jgi:hypothetical protein